MKEFIRIVIFSLFAIISFAFSINRGIKSESALANEALQFGSVISLKQSFNSSPLVLDPSIKYHKAQYFISNIKSVNADIAEIRKFNDSWQKVINMSRSVSMVPANLDQEGLIAFSSSRDGKHGIFIMNIDGSSVIRLSNGFGDDLPSWSPDGSKIAFSSQREGESTTQIYVMNADGSNIKRLTNTIYYNWHPSWSPDGKKIAFATCCRANSWIYVMNIDGSGLTALTRWDGGTYGAGPSWSSTGNKIAFPSWYSGSYDIYIMNADGTGITNLTNNSVFDFDPSWSPDGSKIAFSSNRDGNKEIYVMKADGSGVTRLTYNLADDYEPSWSPDGSQIAFVSDRNGNAEIYIMNADGTGLYNLTNNPASDYSPSWKPIFFVSGRVTDASGNPIQGVTVSAGPAGSAVTNASGYYTISGLPQGEYTLRPSKTGFRFEPETLNVTLPDNRTGQNFRGYSTACAAPLAEPFLRFPVDYGERDFSKIIQDTDEGGLINSWFDHLSPLYTANYSITLYTGKTYSETRTSGPYFGNLYCYDRRCYDGHNGIDIVAPDPGHNPNPQVLAAAEGTVVRVVNSTTGYGKQVWIDHGNNYATLYGHLDRIDVSVGQHVDAGQQLGLMGSTGASGGTHLHFGVYFNYNIRDPWITTTVEARPEEVVDTFRWLGQQNDPWITPSVWLWQESVGKDKYLGQSGGILNTSNVTVTIPAGSVSTDTLFSLNEAPVAEASAQLRNTGLSFLLRILFGLGGSGGQSLSIAAAETLSAPITITVNYADASLRHLDPAHLAPYYYEEATGSWTEIAATFNSSDKTVTFQTESTGDFSLQAPLLCPAESQEPDDHYMLAETLAVPGTASRLIDIADDEDWFLFDATAGQRYVLSTGSLANGVKPVIRLYDTDGVTLLASAEGWRSTLQWQAPADGKYFIRVTPAGDSAYGCEAAYTLSLSRLMQVYLPLVLRNR